MAWRFASPTRDVRCLPFAGRRLLSLHPHCGGVPRPCAAVAWDAFGSVISGPVIVVPEVPRLARLDGLTNTVDALPCAHDAALGDDGFPLGALSLVRRSIPALAGALHVAPVGVVLGGLCCGP